MNRKEEIERALSTLSRRMALSGADSLEVLCCGASALCILGLLSRSTMDVDVLGIISHEKEVLPCEHFSPEMDAAIAASGRELGLPDNWFNGSASVLLQHPLPTGALERSKIHRKEFGPYLVVRFLDRMDQVALKLFASMDPRDGQRHLKDLEEISPTRFEIRHAVGWMSSWKSNQAFRDRLAYLVQGFDFPDLAESIRRAKDIG
jgi:hypothetical protein